MKQRNSIFLEDLEIFKVNEFPESTGYVLTTAGGPTVEEHINRLNNDKERDEWTLDELCSELEETGYRATTIYMQEI